MLKATEIYKSLEPDSRLAILVPAPNNCQVLPKESGGFERLSVLQLLDASLSVKSNPETAGGGNINKIRQISH